jgi:hypothetical protein
MRLSVNRNTCIKLVPLILAGLSSCAPPDPDASLRRFVDEAALAAQARDTGYFRDVVAASYYDASGNDRERIIDLIRGFFLINSRIEAQATIVGIEWSGTESARVTLDTSIVGNAGKVSPQLELELLRDGSDWSVIGASWQERRR